MPEKMKSAGSLGEQFCRRLIDSMPTPLARTILVMELAKWSGKTLYFPAIRHGVRRMNVARNLLENGKSAADAALIIHERFGVTLARPLADHPALVLAMS